jgi:hypothetical protein
LLQTVRFDVMWLTTLYFLSLLFGALALVPPMAHLLELPRKMHLTRDEYVLVQRIYRGWAMLGLVIVVALLSTAMLAVAVRHDRVALAFALASCLCTAATQAVFWTFTYPVNRATTNWSVAPGNWLALRRRWEYSHAASAVLALLALVGVILSALVQVR